MGMNMVPEDPRQGTIREEMLKIVEKRNRPGGRDEIKKQLDGVVKAKPFISPEHYHLSYEIDGKTYPHMDKAWKRSRGAYLELNRLAAWSKEEPVYYESGEVMITTPMKGRTGLFRFMVRVVECFIPACARFETLAVPLVPGVAESQPYVRDDSGLLLPKPKPPTQILGVRRPVTTDASRHQSDAYWKDGTPKTPRRVGR